MEPDLIQTQRRGRRIAMTAPEVDAFLAGQRVCRVATLTASGAPHASPLWFAWDGTSLWLNSLVKSQRWTDIARDPRASVVIDGGNEFGELHGVELRGSFVPVGEAPRTGEPVAELETPERLFAAKYSPAKDSSAKDSAANSPTMHHDGRHAWLRLTPEKVASWDFRKLGI